MIVDDSANALLEGCSAKIHQQSERKIHRTEVGEKLLRVNRRMRFGRFDLNRQRSLDKQICTKGIVYDNAIGLQRNRDLALDG